MRSRKKQEASMMYNASRAIDVEVRPEYKAQANILRSGRKLGEMILKDGVDAHTANRLHKATSNRLEIQMLKKLNSTSDISMRPW
jgi:hypothetical protein